MNRGNGVPPACPPPDIAAIKDPARWTGLLRKSGLAATIGNVPLWMILPGLLLTGIIIGFPLLVLVWTSFHQVSKFGQLLAFNGVDNYLSVLADPLFLASLWRTFIWTFFVVGGTVLCSLPLALILDDDFVGRGLARVIVLLPWSISLTMTAVVWKWALNGPAGLVNVTLMDLGLIDQPIEWLGRAGLAFTVEIVVGIIVSIPFTTTLILGGLSSLPSDIFEAARSTPRRAGRLSIMSHFL
jgi:multiple sugar transport system permease protein